MKRTLFFAGLLALLVLAGCVGTRNMGVLDPSIPEADQCPLEIRNVSVIMFNNQPVNWVRDSMSQNKVTIVLPPGSHSFMIKYYTTHSTQYSTTTYTHTKVLEQEFLPGHSYRLYERRIWLILFTKVDYLIKDVTPKTKA